MTYANQYKVVIEKSNENTWGVFPTSSTKKAMNILKGEHFKLWAYLMMNQNGYELGLSRKDCENWGIKKDSYYRGIDELRKAGYLIEMEPGVFHFVSNPEMEPQKNEPEKPIALTALDF